MATDVPAPWIRRPISLTAVTVGAVLAVPLVLPLMLIGAVIDLITRTRPMRRTRLVAFLSTLLWVDLLGAILTAGAWLLSPLGLRTKSALDQGRYRWIMTRWASMLLSAIGRCVPLEFDYSQIDDEVMAGNAIMIGRHRSLLDAVLPARVIGTRGLVAKYTLKEDLRWEPNIDIVGYRMDHRFVTRNPVDADAELEPIRELGTRIDDRSIGVIFPEGTFFTPERKAKVIASLESKDPELADRAQSMNHVLPPRPGGTLALLDGATEADVILFGHTGFEDFGTIGNIIKNLGGSRKVTLMARRFARSEIPADLQDRVRWLFERWQELDDWVEQQLNGSGPNDLRKSAFSGEVT